MKNYQQLIAKILNTGEYKNDRTGTGTVSLFGTSLNFDLKQGFPLLTTKKMHLSSIVHELIWFLKGETNIKYLKDHNVRIWNEWADENGDLGPVYGKQWRRWEGADGKIFDQISEVINTIRKNPDSRRMVVSAWNVADLPQMNLPPCHILFQFYVSRNGLSCQVYQRSADVFLGVPFDIASYALLTHIIAHLCDLQVNELIYVFGDTHIYVNHLSQCGLLLSREPLQLPKIKISNRLTDIDDVRFEDIEIVGYKSHEKIVASVAI